MFRIKKFAESFLLRWLRRTGWPGLTQKAAGIPNPSHTTSLKCGLKFILLFVFCNIEIFRSDENVCIVYMDMEQLPDVQGHEIQMTFFFYLQRSMSDYLRIFSPQPDLMSPLGAEFWIISSCKILTCAKFCLYLYEIADYLIDKNAYLWICLELWAVTGGEVWAWDNVLIICGIFPSLDNLSGVSVWWDCKCGLRIECGAGGRAPQTHVPRVPLPWIVGPIMGPGPPCTQHLKLLFLPA